jgi:hypothetical protein
MNEEGEPIDPGDLTRKRREIMDKPTFLTLSQKHFILKPA